LIDSHIETYFVYILTGPLDFSPTRIPPEAPTLGIPVHPDVRFKLLPFYDLITELTKPTSLCM